MNRRQFARCLGLMCTGPLAGLNVQSLANDIAAQSSVTNSLKRRLVLVELAGANDGLNTLVPFTNDHYHTLRPTIGLSAKDVFKLDSHFGLHPSLAPLMPIWEAGELAWLQGLGYPKPNRSHFKSIALWESGGDGERQYSSDGWMTHAIEHRIAREVADPHGISFSGGLGLFASSSGRWLSMKRATDMLEESAPKAGGNAIDHAALSVLQSRLQMLNTTLAGMSAKVADTPEVPAFKGGKLGEQLRQVSTLIKAGIDTPVYRVQLTGFDTHDNQRARHPRLLKSLALALSDFRATLKSMSEWQNTLVMTYSEFGRRAAENQSGGTDHGTAAPHLVMGGSVRGGLVGAAPELSELVDGDPTHTMDYRAAYHQVLVDGLGVLPDSANRKGSLEPYQDERLIELIRVG